ncbi:YqhR family membrane protein [Paenibacillus sp. KQZ6P-2]|uniref:YqhR family membrane protein n=1 Tax=Paenibacillus mangrovi TaxID=2931978 RepID=A0A9X1WP96_9BACL|nr:YqhR family membrane protein [Paenibacillus mangrovi]MCJ8011203.1 YqhR family membrane protein [Paenibacillus mangrovi]
MTTQAAVARQKSQQGHTNPLAFALELGFFAGLFWGFIHWVFYTFHFTKVIPGYLGEPFFNHSFLKSGAGQLAGWLLFIAFSTIASIIYVFLFRKKKGPWPGILYGLVWWCIIFVIIGPPLHMMKPIGQLDWNSIVSEFCLYILWGLFIGYTVSVEFNDERLREPNQAKA